MEGLEGEKGKKMPLYFNFKKIKNPKPKKQPKEHKNVMLAQSADWSLATKVIDSCTRNLDTIVLSVVF